MDKSIKQVFAVEAKAQKIRTDAENKAQKIIEKAKQDAIDLLESLEEKNNKNRDDLIRKAEAKLLKKREELLAVAQKEKKALNSVAKKKMPKAIDYVVSLLKENA